ncbi:MAG TPA: vWA domain-containing protein, partial [Pirellulaceae bacterium]|nr:vWA domain-containing protein [Pirellulaceae bacterium]
VHLALLVTLGLFMTEEVLPPVVQTIESRMPPPEEDLLTTELDEFNIPATEISVSTPPATVSVGVADGSNMVAGGATGASSAVISAPRLDNSVAQAVEASEIRLDALLSDAPPPGKIIAEAPDGALGDPRSIVDNYQQAMDQITQEIVWFMDKGPVLVVWCFDQSESMKDDQKEIRDRVERVYAELGLSSHKSDRLMTAVASFGQGFALHTSTPTSNRDQIRAAIDAVPNDPTGVEMMCEAVGRSIAHHQEYARRTNRQMLLVLVTDESGNAPNNDQYLEQAIAQAKAAKCRCYVLGREAVFGYPYAHISWVHPQTKHTHWLQIDRGPETAFVEQLQTDGFRRRYDAHASGFGPYEQTRLARETGGIFFMLPGLESNLVRGEKRRYELEAMRSYRPDMRAKIEIVTDRDASVMRSSIYKVIYDLNPYDPQIAKFIEMRVHFSPDFPTFVKQVREEQTKAIIYLQYLARAQQAMEALASLRQEETSPRWQANYDLIYAQIIAYQARMYEYGAYLESFVQQPKVVPLKKEPNLTLVHWDIRTRKDLLTTESKPYIDKAARLYQQILVDHPGTPWSARAEQELKRGFGVSLAEVYWP